MYNQQSINNHLQMHMQPHVGLKAAIAGPKLDGPQWLDAARWPTFTLHHPPRIGQVKDVIENYVLGISVIVIS